MGMYGGIDWIKMSTLKSGFALFDSVVPVIQQAIFSNIAYKPWDDVAPLLKYNMKKDIEFLEKIANDEEIKNAIREWVEAYASYGIDVLGVTKPTIDTLLDEIWGSINGVMKKASVGAINTGLNVSTGMISAIPIIGGPIAIIIAFLRGINTALLSLAPAVEGITATTGTLTGSLNKFGNIKNIAERRILKHK